MEGLHFAVKLSFLALPILALEPGMVSSTGGTIGHHLIGLRIRDATRDVKIGFFRALLRFIIRGLLGVVSLVFILITRRHQAIHDYVTRSIVVLRRSEGIAERERQVERTESAAFEYPSRTRRSIVTLLYLIVSFVVLSITVNIVVSVDCIENERCTDRETVVVLILGLIWLISVCIGFVLGWRGQLLGARRTPTTGLDSNADTD